MKKYLLACTVLFSLCYLLPATAQKASNIKYQSLGNKIIITFDLSGATKNVRIWIQPGLVSGDNPSNYEVIKSVSGDVGLIQSIDGPKVITWDLFKDITVLPPGFNIDIKVKTESRVPTSEVISLAGNSLAPLGLKYQRLGLQGFYVSGKILNFDFSKVKGTSNELENGKITPESPYQFLEAQRQSFCFNAGYSRMIKPSLFVYGGLGAGIDRTVWKVVNLDADCNPTTNIYWVEYAEGSTPGKLNWLLEAGTNVKFNRIVLDAGIGLNAGKDVYFNFGLGYVFRSKN